MCFSPQASFLAGVTLTMIGLAALHRANQHKRSELLPLAATPLIFGIQQFLEGTLWFGLLGNHYQETLYQFGLYGFLFFALFWWPWWVPYAILRCEQKPLQKRIMTFFSLAGLALGIYLFWPPLSAQLIGGHIAYITTNGSPILSLLYLFIVITPFFITSIGLMWLLGILALIGLAVSIAAYFTWLGSVWCFFAALISTGIYALIRRMTA